MRCAALRPKSSCAASPKALAQAAIVRRRLLGDRAHHRHQLAPQLREQRLHRGRRHALVGVVDQRIGDVVVGREELGILAAEVERRSRNGTMAAKSFAGRARVQAS